MFNVFIKQLIPAALVGSFLLLRNQKVNYRVHDNVPLDPALSHMYCQLHVICLKHSRPRLHFSSGLFSADFSAEVL